MATKKKAASPVIPILLILVCLALLAVGAWLLLSRLGLIGKNAQNNQHEFTMQVGEQKTLEVPFENSYTCTSSETTVVDYDSESKLLSAYKAGSATVVAKDDVTGDSELYIVTVVGDGTAAPASQTTTTEATTTKAADTSETTLPPGSVTGITLSYYQASVPAGSKYPYAIVEMQPRDAVDKSELWTSDDENVAVVDRSGNIIGISEGETIIRVTSVNNPKVFAEIAVTVTHAETTTAATDLTGETVTTTADTTPTVTSKGFPIEVRDGITYIAGVMIANKTYSLPATYAPGIQPEAQAAFNEMQAAAIRDGITQFEICSGFRSYSTQNSLYNRYAARDGKAAADRYSARPGYSEHQTGLAFDINRADDSFTNTPAAKWLAENCWKYGFIIRYPQGKENITGYMYESWHVRYLGKELAQKVQESGLTLEEYFGITSRYAD